jgi:hypothetical protein
MTHQEMGAAQIPPMTHELGAYWEQPDPKDIRLEDGLAFMEKATFRKLAQYDTTLPTGVYVGKMWKCKVEDDEWWLRWFIDSETNPANCTMKQALILVTDWLKDTDGVKP